MSNLPDHCFQLMYELATILPPTGAGRYTISRLGGFSLKLPRGTEVPNRLSGMVVEAQMTSKFPGTASSMRLEEAENAPTS
jgi:hypothetical protein